MATNTRRKILLCENSFCVFDHPGMWGGSLGGVQVALLGDDSCKWPFIQKAKPLTPVCGERSNYLKLLLKILSLASCVSLFKG